MERTSCELLDAGRALGCFISATLAEGMVRWTAEAVVCVVAVDEADGLTGVRSDRTAKDKVGVAAGNEDRRATEHGQREDRTNRTTRVGTRAVIETNVERALQRPSAKRTPVSSAPSVVFRTPSPQTYETLKAERIVSISLLQHNVLGCWLCVLITDSLDSLFFRDSLRRGRDLCRVCGRGAVLPDDDLALHVTL